MKLIIAALALPAATAVHAAPPASFAQCSVCHTVTKGGLNGIGPNVYGVVGRKAGSVAGFNYSTALKKSGKVWTPAALDKWLTNPAAFVPGSRMPYAGMADAKKRAEIIAYLKTLK